MAILLRPFLDPDFALDPGKIAATRLLPQEFLVVTDQFRHDAAAGDIVFVHQDKAAGGFERRREVERDRSLRAERQFRDLIAADRLAALLLIKSIVSMIRWIAATSHSTSFVATRSRYLRPSSNGRLPEPEQIRLKGS